MLHWPDKKSHKSLKMFLKSLQDIEPIDPWIKMIQDLTQNVSRPKSRELDLPVGGNAAILASIQEMPV